ncbi:MAG: type III secretion system chaperone [Bacteroidota bacterium]
MRPLTQSLLIFSLFFLAFSSALTAQDMDNRKMSRILSKEAESVEGQLGSWQAVYGNRLIYVITDQNANRMRIMTAIVELKDVKQKEYKVLLEANFDRALDAKFAIFEDYLMSVYTHPLKELTEEQFIDAMRQVVTLAYTYGSSYTSTNMVFGGGEEEQTEEKKEKDK